MALERQAELKSEYLDGDVLAMSGASLNHNRISANLLVTVHTQIRGGSCDALHWIEGAPPEGPELFAKLVDLTNYCSVLHDDP